MRKLLILILLAIILLGDVSAGYNILGNGICECWGCAGCTSAINNNINCGAEVRLTLNLIDQPGTCIDDPSNFNNKIFDCQGHTIDGDNSVDAYGIYIYNKQNDVIRNCIITDFDYGIYLESSSNNNLTKNTVNNNNFYGIYIISSSNNNNLTKNIENNNVYGIYIDYPSNDNQVNLNRACNNFDTDIYNEVSNTGNTGDENQANTGYNWNDEGTTGFSYACGECLCDDCLECITYLNDISCSLVKLRTNITEQAGTCIDNPANFINKTFNCQNHTIDGTHTETDYGIYLNGKTNDTIKNCVVTEFNSGMYLNHSLNNTLINNTAKNNSYGIYLESSSNNNLTKNTVNNNNFYGIYIISSSNNNNLTKNTVNNNSENGITLNNSLDNTLTTNLVCNNTATDIYSSNSETIGADICDTTYNYFETDSTGCSANCSVKFCYNYSDCSAQSTSVVLYNNINDVSGDCITLSEGEILNCLTHIIDGNDTGTAITTANNSVVKFCEIQQFYNGINSTEVVDVSIRFNTIHDIRHYPLLFEHANATIVNNTFYENSWSRGYKANGNCNLSWSNNSILMNYTCADDAGCSASILFIIIAGGGLTVYYFRKTQ